VSDDHDDTETVDDQLILAVLLALAVLFVLVIGGAGYLLST
jgi:hypothetical protein